VSILIQKFCKKTNKNENLPLPIFDLSKFNNFVGKIYLCNEKEKKSKERVNTNRKETIMSQIYVFFAVIRVILNAPLMAS
jgi:hypothetical protein